MELTVDITSAVARELKERRPWMHTFKLGDDAYVGTFKYHLLPDTVFLRSEPQLFAEGERAYADVASGAPFAHIDQALERLGVDVGETTFLDIACATGMYSFHLAGNGAKEVRGVEIRRDQVEQARFLQGLDERFALPSLHFDHVAMSADDPSYLGDERYDVVLSLGLLYHLADPVQHLRNLRRLARRGIVLHTLTNLYGKPGLWTHVAEDPTVITKATAGISWMPYYRDLPALLESVGFDRVEYVRHPLMGNLQPPPRAAVLRRAAGLMTPPALAAAWSRTLALAQTKRREHALLRGLIPGYYTVVAWS
jgi:SAM-dependent methyltransferase